MIKKTDEGVLINYCGKTFLNRSICALENELMCN